MIDIFITTFLRPHFAKLCVKYLTERTITPFRITIIDNGGNEWAENDPGVYRYIPLGKIFGNTGIHFAWNVAVSLAEGEYFITTDPDILVPNLIEHSHDEFKTATEAMITIEHTDDSLHSHDWLEQMIKFMDERPDYAAISMHPHVFIGAAGIDPNDPEDVIERNMCGAVMRIMRTQDVRDARGWELKIEAGRNHEERTICSRLQAINKKVGICSRIRAYHMFGDNWGYPEEFTPEMQKHNPQLKEYVKQFDNQDAYNPKTWLPK